MAVGEASARAEIEVPPGPETEALPGPEQPEAESAENGAAAGAGAAGRPNCVTAPRDSGRRRSAMARSSGIPACRPMRSPCLAIVVMAFAPLHGQAQLTVGIVVEEGTGAPVQGAMVILFDSTRTQVASTFSNAAGRFLVRAEHPGFHYIRVERIGYADWTTDLFEPQPGEPLTIRMPVQAVRLKRLDVSAGRRCEVRPEEGKATARVWEEVRKALAAEALTRAASLYRYTLVRYQRKLDRRGRKTNEQTAAVLEDMPAAFRSFPIEDLVTRGFVQTTDDSTVYYAPDAEALLSDAFLDTHCFGLREGEEGEEEMIGLVFRPLEGREVPELGGVLWLNAETSELERLEFEYLNLMRSREVGEPGGEVSFTRLPDGAWIVRDWRIRMPQLKGSRLGLRRTGYIEDSGVLWAITDSAGREILHAETATLSGVVTDSAGTGPPTGPVVVELAESGMRTVPEEDGSFLLTGLEEGLHTLRVRRPLHSAWGIEPPEEVAIEGRRGEIAHLRLRTPGIADALAAACGGAPRPGGTVAFMGRITTPTGSAAAGAAVSVRWLHGSGYSPAPVAAPFGPEGTPDPEWTLGRDGMFATATTTTDWRGLFLLCDVPAGTRLQVRLAESPTSDPLLTNTYDPPPGRPAIVARLVIPQ